MSRYYLFHAGIYRVIRNDCRGFNNSSYTIHLRQEYMCFLLNTFNAELNAIGHLLVFLWVRHIFHVSRIRVNRTKFQTCVTYLIGALYVHPLWLYKHQHDNRVRSKLFVACQRWWFQWRFWFVPSVVGYLREEDEHKPDPWRNLIERNHMGLHLENEVAVVKTPIIFSNYPV